MATVALTSSDRLRPLLAAESAGLNNGATHGLRFTHADLVTITSAGDDGTFTVSLPQAPTAAAPVYIECVGYKLTRAFTSVENSGTAAVNGSTFLVGNPDDTDQYLAAKKYIEGDDPVPHAEPIASNGLTFTAATNAKVIITIGPDSGKVLGDLDRGILDLYFKIRSGHQAIAAA